MTATPQKNAKSFKMFAAAVMACGLLAGGFMFSANGQDAITLSPAGLPVHKLVIEKQGGGSETFRVEVAEKSIDLQIGLMHRKHMDSDAGMLFYFGGGEGEVSFWMKNTLIPLDMVFIRGDGSVAHIHENAEPESLARVPSRFPVAAVLELNGGETARRGIKPGDQVKHAFFRAAETRPAVPVDAPAPQNMPEGDEPAPLPDALPDTDYDREDVPSVINDMQKPGLDSEAGQP